MLLIFSPKITNRIKYSFDLLFNKAINCEYTLTENKSEYQDYAGPKLNYSNRPISEIEIYIFAHGILSDIGVKYYHEEFSGQGESAVIFKNKSKGDYQFDVIGASFYLVTRYEEYLPHKKDRHKRFKPESSFAFKNDFLDKPLINIWALKLAETIKSKFPEFTYSLPKYNYQVTFDIDNAYAYKNKGFSRIFSGLLNAALSFKFDKFSERLSVVQGKKQDPYDTYHILSDWQNRYSFQPVYFFLAGDYGKYDKNVPLANIGMQTLMKNIAKNATIGLHPSFASNQNSQKIAKEKDKVEEIINSKIEKSRQHYIMLSFPDTYRNLIDKGIKEDFSMGYASKIGFRASICTPFYFFDLLNETQTPLLVHTFMIMDTTLKHYLKIRPEDAIGYAKPIIDEVKKYGGEMVTIFHNDSLSQLNGWKKWDIALEDIIKEGTVTY